MSLSVNCAESSRPALFYRPCLEMLERRELPSTCTVDRLSDNKPNGGGEGGNGMGDLRWCVIESVYQADIIDFSVTGTINLAAVLPTLTRNVSIDGPGADLVTVRRDSGGDYTIFNVVPGVTAEISGLTISNGSYGGIINFGKLTISISNISDNTTSNSGGGILNAGTLTVNNSTISGNVASSSSEFQGSGGGIYNNGVSLTINNSTLANNSATGYGGGICCGTAPTVVYNSTISGNAAIVFGGGIVGGNGMAVRNTIIARNTAPAGPDVYTKLGSLGHNLIGNPQEMSGWVDSDLLHVDPLLGPLQNNCGATETYALLPGSPALNAGDPAQLGVPDQRGVVRSGGVNIGAYQASAFDLVAPDTVTTGVPFDLVVTAVDPFGQVAVGYSGTATFTTSDDDPNVQVPADYTFNSADAGMVTFPGGVTLISLGAQTIQATDTVDGTIIGTASVTVTSAVRPLLLWGGADLAGDCGHGVGAAPIASRESRVSPFLGQ
jgi:hypothetical protein